MRKNLYKIARWMGHYNAARRAIRSKSTKPLWKRLLNVLIGRYIVGKLWIK